MVINKGGQMRQNVTFEEIVNAAESIKAKGHNPTIERIRITIGSRGSNSTIARHLNNWRKINNSHQECFLPQSKSSNEDYIVTPYNNAKINTNLYNELHDIKMQNAQLCEENASNKQELAALHKHQYTWEREKEKYVNDLKQAHQISLQVLTENYRHELDKIEKKVNSLLSKMEQYLQNHNKEREILQVKLQKLTNQAKITRMRNKYLQRKLLMLQVKLKCKK